MTDYATALDELRVLHAGTRTGSRSYKDAPLAEMDNFELRVGKHKGKRFRDILINERDYSRWVLQYFANSPDDANSPLSLFYIYLKRSLSTHD